MRKVIWIAVLLICNLWLPGLLSFLADGVSLLCWCIVATAADRPNPNSSEAERQEEAKKIRMDLILTSIVLLAIFAGFAYQFHR